MLKTHLQEYTRAATGPDLYAEELEFGTPEYEQAQRLQDERFAKVQTVQSEAQHSYVAATQVAPTDVIHLAIRRVKSTKRSTRQRRGNGSKASQDELIGTARLELPGATLIESMISLREGSLAAHALATRTAAEIGGFASSEAIDRWTVLDVVDAVVAAVIELARRHDLKWLWIFPRSGFMSIMRAEIENVLPPYHFALCPDVAGWQENSERLTAFRAMRLRGFAKHPLVYQISTDVLEQDLHARLALYDQRHALLGQGDTLLRRAMVRAERTIRQEIDGVVSDAASPSLTQRKPKRVQKKRSTPPSTDIPAATTIDVQGESLQHDTPSPAHAAQVNFLPADLSARLSLATYLQRVLVEGGEPAREYKQLSYTMLAVQPGMRVLDVGCGAGVDLVALSRLTGTQGKVVGLETNPALVRAARRALASNHDENLGQISVVRGDAHHMTISDAKFDRVRADRAIQHFADPKQAIIEMWRVLKPGGILSLVEPDWGAMVVSPSCISGDEHDATAGKVFDWCRRHLAHPLIGRELHGLLHCMPVEAWDAVRVDVMPFTFLSWHRLDAVLLLSGAADALARERPDLATELQEWLQAVVTATEQGSFFAYVPLFFATARKAARKKPRVRKDRNESNERAIQHDRI